MTFFSVVYDITLITVFGLSLFLRTQHQSIQYSWLCLYLLVTFCVELSSRIVNLYFNHLRIDWLYNVYILFCILFFGIYYSGLFIKVYRYITLIVTLCSLIIFFLISDYSFAIYDPNLGLLISFFYVILSLIWYFHSLNYGFDTKITENPYFWISTALVIWGSFYIFRNYPAQYLYEKDPSFHTVLKNINYIVATIMYGLMGIGLLKFKKQKM
jgi:hypothetical protein